MPFAYLTDGGGGSGSGGRRCSRATNEKKGTEKVGRALPRAKGETTGVLTRPRS